MVRKSHGREGITTLYRHLRPREAHLAHKFHGSLVRTHQATDQEVPSFSGNNLLASRIPNGQRSQHQSATTLTITNQGRNAEWSITACVVVYCSLSLAPMREPRGHNAEACVAWFGVAPPLSLGTNERASTSFSLNPAPE